MKASNLLKELIRYFNKNSEEYSLTLNTLYEHDYIYVNLKIGDSSDEIDLISVKGYKESVEDVYKTVLDKFLEYNLTYLREYNGLD